MAKERFRANSGIVVMLDALGIRKKDLEGCRNFIRARDALLDIYHERMRGFATFTDILKRTVFKHSDVKNAPNKPNVVTLGDMIVFTSEWPECPEILLAFFSLTWLSESMKWCILNRLPIRGAIAIGEYIEDGSTILGPAVADAAECSEKAEWMGMVATPEAGQYIERFVENMSGHPDVGNNTQAYFVKYEVPLKLKCGKRIRKALWVVPWPLSFLPGLPGSNVAFEKAISAFERESRDEPKYENTTLFFNWYEQNIMPQLNIRSLYQEFRDRRQRARSELPKGEPRE